MPKQNVSTEIEGIKTDTYDKIDATLSFVVEGNRNVPNLQNVGKAADAATWLFQKLIEASYIKDANAHAAEVAVIKQQVKDNYLAPA